MRPRRKSRLRRSSSQTVVVYEALEPRHLLAGNVFISEFVASNVASFEDGFGSAPDWIELRNSGDTPVDLLGYHLTDKQSDPTGWTFNSSTLIQPDSYLVVFASNRDTIDPLGYHHTDFKLKGKGEYLALYDASGVLLSEFGSDTEDYPAQVTDISYGVSSRTLVSGETASHYLIPTNGNLGTSWTANGFAAQANGFSDGFSAIGYEDSSGSATSYANEFLTQIPSGTTTVYLRSEFEVSDVSAIHDLTLDLKYDDGFGVYLNGTFLFSRNAPGTLAWDSPATTIHADSDALVFESFKIDGSAGSEGNGLNLLVDGTNTLAIHALNRPSSSDFLLVPVLKTHSLLGSEGYFTATPGQLNAEPILLGPMIDEVTPSGTTITPGQTLTITAEISDFGRPVDVNSAELHYRIMFGGELVVAMNDVGVGADVTAGDGVYSATLDSSGVAAGQMVRWYVTASDIDGNTTRAPRFLRPLDSAEYYGTVVTDAGINTDLPLFQWFVQNTNAAATDAGTRASLFYNGEFYDNIQVDVHGQSTRSFPKKSFDFDANSGDKFLVGDLGRASDFNLITNWADQTKVRHPLSYEFFTESGLPVLDGFSITVYRNGSFYGLYDIIEEGDEEYLERVGLDPNGALYKVNNRLTSTTTDVEKKSRKYEDNSEFQAVVDANLLNGSAAAIWDFDNLDVAEVINYLAVQTIVSNDDFGHKNMYWFRDVEGTGLWSVLPWDQDLSFGHAWRGTYFDNTLYTNVSNGLAGGGANNLFQQIIADPVMGQMWARRIRTLSDQFLGAPGTNTADSYLHQRLDEIEAAISDENAQDFALWGWHSNFNPFPTTSTEAIQQIRDFYIGGRRTFIGNASQIPNSQVGIPGIVFDVNDFDSDPVSGLQSQEYIRLNNPTSSSVDISGWTLTGGINHTFKGGTVLAAGGSIYVVADIIAFKARTTGPAGGQRLFIQGNYQGQLSNSGEVIDLVATDGSTVDTLTTPDLGTSDNQQFLRISEIHYNPDANGVEYIEFLNTSSGASATTLDLTGIAITEGVSFVFAGGTSLEAGQRILVVKDAVDFAAAYPGVGSSLIAGEYGGGLKNSGENIRVEEPGGEVVVEFGYDDSDPWAIAADGAGSSLQLVNETSTASGLFGKYYSWRASHRVGGTPGTAPNSANASVVINEILAHTDLPQSDYVELYNAGSASIDVGGWYLSDSKSELLKYQIPANTVIAAGGYLIIDESDFNPTPGSPGANDFALSALGDQVWLTTVVGGQPFAIIDGVDFGATFNGQSLGRTSDGVGRFVPQAAVTPHAANSATKLGPILLTEINYHPDDPTGADLAIDPTLVADDLEFVEVHNSSSASVDTTNWALAGEVSFDFPSDSIAGGATWLIVSFDPADTSNADKVAAFRNHYGIGTGVTLVGGFSGKLSNSFGRVTLQKPDQPPFGSTVFPHVITDELVYDDLAPWPDADGNGSSLQRIAGNLAGTLVSSWTASVPTPGSVALNPVGPKVIALVRDSADPTRPDLIETLSFTFDADVSISAGDLTLVNDTLGGTPVDISAAVFSYDSQNFTAVWDLGGLATPLPAAFYTVSLASSSVTGIQSGLNLDGDADGSAGGDVVQQIYVAIPGDANLDGDVDASEFDFGLGKNAGDLFVVRQNLGSDFTSWALGDFNGDGDIDASEFDFGLGINVGDLFVVRQNLGRDVRPTETGASNLSILSSRVVGIESPILGSEASESESQGSDPSADIDNRPSIGGDSSSEISAPLRPVASWGERALGRIPVGACKPQFAGSFINTVTVSLKNPSNTGEFLHYANQNFPTPKWGGEAGRRGAEAKQKSPVSQSVPSQRTLLGSIDFVFESAEASEFGFLWTKKEVGKRSASGDAQSFPPIEEDLAPEI